MQSLNDICYLLTEGKTIKNENGFKVKTEPTKEEVYCGVKSATRTEFYNAMKNGIRIAYVFVLAYDDYNDQRQLEYNGKRYQIERVYRTSEYYIELSCSEVE